MDFKQAIAAGVIGPVFVNETGGQQAIAGVVFVNETAMPFGGLVWDQPTRRLDSQRDFSPQNLLALTAVVQAPFATGDWPSAKRRVLAPSDTLPANLLPLSVVPFVSFGGDLTARRDSPRARDWQAGNDINTRTAVPFQPSDWPLPRAGRLLTPDAAYTNLLPLNAQVVLPFAQFNWPLAARVMLKAFDSIPANLLPILVPPTPPTPTHKSGTERLRQSTIAKINRALAMNLIDSAVVRENLEELVARLRQVDLPSATAYAYDSIAQIPEALLLRESGWTMTEIYALVDEVVSEREDEDALIMLLRSQL